MAFDLHDTFCRNPRTGYGIGISTIDFTIRRTTHFPRQNGCYFEHFIISHVLCFNSRTSGKSILADLHHRFYSRSSVWEVFAAEVSIHHPAVVAPSTYRALGLYQYTLRFRLLNSAPTHAELVENCHTPLSNDMSWHIVNPRPSRQPPVRSAFRFTRSVPPFVRLPSYSFPPPHDDRSNSSRVQCSDFKLSSVIFRPAQLPLARLHCHRSPSTAYRSPPFTLRPPLTAHRPPPTAHRSPRPTAHRPPATTYRHPPSTALRRPPTAIRPPPPSGDHLPPTVHRSPGRSVFFTAPYPTNDCVQPGAAARVVTGAFPAFPGNTRAARR